MVLEIDGSRRLKLVWRDIKMECGAVLARRRGRAKTQVPIARGIQGTQGGFSANCPGGLRCESHVSSASVGRLLGFYPIESYRWLVGRSCVRVGASSSKTAKRLCREPEVRISEPQGTKRQVQRRGYLQMAVARALEFQRLAPPRSSARSLKSTQLSSAPRSKRPSADPKWIPAKPRLPCS